MTAEGYVLEGVSELALLTELGVSPGAVLVPHQQRELAKLNCATVLTANTQNKLLFEQFVTSTQNVEWLLKSVRTCLLLANPNNGKRSSAAFKSWRKLNHVWVTRVRLLCKVDKMDQERCTPSQTDAKPVCSNT